MGFGKGAVDSVKDAVNVVVKSTVLFSFIMVFAFGLPIAMIVMGAIHLDECQAERMIPIYLIVAGSFGVFRSILTICNRRREDEERTMVDHFVSVIDCFLFAWFITGCVYIYRTKDEFQSMNKTLSNYCDHSFYWFAFWVVTAHYIIIGIILFILLIVMCCAVCC